MKSPHVILNPTALAAPIGFAHAVASAPGRLIWLGGQTAHDAAGNVRGESIVEQFDAAAGNVVEALREAGASAAHLVWLQIFVTEVEEYRASLTDLSRVYRRHFGRHYPAMALFEVSGLLDARARVELMGVAVVSP